MKNINTKNIILVIVVVGIVGVIAFINAKKTSIPNTPATDVLTSPIENTAAQQGSVSTDRTAVLAAKAKKYSKAKELSDPTGFVNTDPIKLSDIVGKKVILVDFWTYSCINCQRTIPYLNAWYDKYKDQGLEIVGVHTPEFDFEKDINNVKDAVMKAGIKYPVVLDSNMGTWNAYGNQYWPHEYLIDIDGYVVDDHIGEGGYDQTEKAIQAALAERAQVLGTNTAVSTGIATPTDAIAMTDSGVQSPETYFGAERNEYLGNGTQFKIMTQSLTIPTSTKPNMVYLDGSWNFQYEYAENTSATAHIQYTYSAKNVYLVGSAKHPVTLNITLDGKRLDPVTVSENRLYDIVKGTDYGSHTLQIEVVGAGLDAYTFTFG
jgi:thiol-disulfide isomerase/thioredoxin